MNTIKNVKISVEVAVFKRTKYWIAYAPALKTYGYSAKSEKDALKDFEKAIKVFLEVHSKLNSLREVLLNLGWTHSDSTLQSPKYFNANVSELRGINKTHNKSFSIPEA